MYPFQGAGSCDSFLQHVTHKNIPLVNVWGSRNVDGYLVIKGPSFYMFSIHMCVYQVSLIHFTLLYMYICDVQKSYKTGTD